MSDLSQRPPKTALPNVSREFYLLNFLNGFLNAAGKPTGPEWEPLVRRTQKLIAAYPEIESGPILPQEVRADHPNLAAQAFGTSTRTVLAVVNLSPEPVQAALWVPGIGSLLYDRLDEAHVPLAGGLAWLDLPGYAQVAYELR
jgi:hypothetical protein